MRRVLVGIVALALVIVVVDFVAGPFFAFSTQHWPPERHGNRMVGVIEAVLKRVDSATGVMHVASGVLGLETLRIVVVPDTIVTVGDKLGGLPDLQRAYFVRVTYETQPSRLLARRVDLIDRGTHAPEAVIHQLMAEAGRPMTAAALAAADTAPAPRGMPGAAAPASKITNDAQRRPPASRNSDVAAAKPRPPAAAPSARAPAARPKSRAVAAAPPSKSPSPPRSANPPSREPAQQDAGLTSPLDLPFPGEPAPRADDPSGASAVSVNMPATPSPPPSTKNGSSRTTPKGPLTAQTARPTRPSQLP